MIQHSKYGLTEIKPSGVMFPSQMLDTYLIVKQTPIQYTEGLSWSKTMHFLSFLSLCSHLAITPPTLSP